LIFEPPTVNVPATVVFPATPTLPPSTVLLLVVKVVKLPAAGVKDPRAILSIVPRLVGLKARSPDTFSAVKVPVPGVTEPILTLSIVPTTEEELITTLPDKFVVPDTVSPFNVPTLVRLLVVTFGPNEVVLINRVEPLDIDPVDSDNVPPSVKLLLRLRLPLASTMNPGLTKPVADLKGSIVNGLTKFAIMLFLIDCIYALGWPYSYIVPDGKKIKF
jgi:hypothetical protein